MSDDKAIVFHEGTHVVHTKHGVVTVIVPSDVTLASFKRVFEPVIRESHFGSEKAFA